MTAGEPGVMIQMKCIDLVAERAERGDDMRRLVVLFAMIAICSGCAKETEAPPVASAGKPSGAAAAPAASAKADARDAALRYVRCARAEGLEVKDPSPDGRFDFPRGDKTDPAYLAAITKCAPLLPPGGGQAPPAPLTEEQLAAMRKYAKCMRDNGLPGFKDPTAQGFTDDSGPQSGTAEFDKAYRACVRIVQPGADPEAPGVG